MLYFNKKGVDFLCSIKIRWLEKQGIKSSKNLLETGWRCISTNLEVV